MLGAPGLRLLLSLFCGVLCIPRMERAEVADPTRIFAAGEEGADKKGCSPVHCKGHLLMFQQSCSVRDG